MNLPLAPLIAAVLGILAGFGVAAMPVDVLENFVMDSGLPAILAAAEPPLGATARALLALGSAVLVGGLAWVMLFILIGSRGVMLGEPRRAATTGEPGDALRAPVLRRADAHPDAPPRPPLRATLDLGMPFLDEVPGDAVRALEEVPFFSRTAIVREVEEVAVLDAAFGVPEIAGARPDRVTPAREVEKVAAAALPEATSEVEKVAGLGAKHVAGAMGEAEKTLAFGHAREVEEVVAVSPPVERPLPADLGQPLAAFDPQAIPATPLPSPVAPRRLVPKPPLFDEGERFETFELTPPPPAPRRVPMPLPRPEMEAAPAPAPAPTIEPPIARPNTDASVHALLDRLERGVLRNGLAQRPEPAPAPRPRDAERGLEDTLATLRNLARRA